VNRPGSPFLPLPHMHSPRLQSRRVASRRFDCRWFDPASCRLDSGIREEAPFDNFVFNANVIIIFFLKVISFQGFHSNHSRYLQL